MKDKVSLTKISISKKLHQMIKDICIDNGLKMQFFGEKAIEEYIKKNFPAYVNHKD